MRLQFSFNDALAFLQGKMCIAGTPKSMRHISFNEAPAFLLGNIRNGTMIEMLERGLLQ